MAKNLSKSPKKTNKKTKIHTSSSRSLLVTSKSKKVKLPEIHSIKTQFIIWYHLFSYALLILLFLKMH